MEFLYIDESGAFERDAVRPLTSLVGGFVTSAPPPEVLVVLRRLHAALRAHPALGGYVGEHPNDLHGRDLLPALDGARHVATFWTVVAHHLRDLPDVQLVAAHYLRDAEILVGVAADRRAFNRYLRMWQTLVRNVVHTAPWPAPALPALVDVYTAQRTLPRGELRGEDAELAAAFGVARLGDEAEVVRVADNAQVPGLLRGVADRQSRALYARRLRSVGVDAPRVLIRKLGETGLPPRDPVADAWEQLERRPTKAGLMLADLACGLLRWMVDGGIAGATGGTGAAGVSDTGRDLHLPPVFRIAYDPTWARYEWLAEAAPTSGDALAELLSLAVAPSTASLPDPDDIDATAEAWLHAACRRLAASLPRVAADHPKLRALLVAACQAELDLKAGAFPRCELVFARGALAPTQDFDEQVARLTFANHAGRDVDRGGVRRLVEAHLDADAGLLLGRGEALAHLSVGLRDEFDYDEAVRLLEPWYVRAHRVLGALETHARWTTYARVASCLAQNYAYRQDPDDLPRACAIYRDVRRHFSSDSDLGQWACHAGNLGVVAGDDTLLQEGLTHLFGAADTGTVTSALEGARFTRNGASGRMFAFTVVSRAAAIGRTATCQDLRAALQEPERWRRLVENIRDAPRRHPLDLYARHLLEIAPRAEDTDALLTIALEAAPGEERVPSLCRAATLAVSTRRLFSTGRLTDGEACARRALATFVGPFEHNAWCSTTTLSPVGFGLTGWFDASVRALQGRSGAAEVDELLRHFRFEWR